MREVGSFLEENRAKETGATARSHTLVELEGKDTWYCQGVADPGLVIRLLPRLRLVSSVVEFRDVAR